MPKNNKKDEKTFKQVSLPVPLLEAISEAADASGRSVPKEIEHAFYIAKTLANMLPEKNLLELKKGTVEIQDLTDILSKGRVDKVLERIIEENPVRFSADPDYPGLYIRADTTTTVRGIVTKDGKFQPIYEITK